MNNSNSKFEAGSVVIDLKEMLWRLLEQWKIVIVFLIVFTILFLSVTYIVGNRVPDGEEGNVVLTPQDQLEQLSPVIQERIISAYNMSLNINDLNSYITKAPIMKLNPKSVKSLVGVWLISSEEGKAELITSLYTDKSVRFEIAEKMAGAFSEADEIGYLAELISMGDNNMEGSVSNETEHALRMTVFMPDEVDAEAVRDSVDSAVKDFSEKISASVGSHSVDLISSDIITVSSEYVSDKQTGTFNELNSVYSQRKLALEALSKEQKTVYTNIMQGINVVENPTDTVPLISLKRLCLSILLGAVLYIIIFICKILFSSSVQSPSQVEDLFGIKTLGECYPVKTKKDIAAIMVSDDGISKLRHKGHNDIKADSEKASESILAVTKTENISNLMLVSNDRSGSVTREYIDELSEKLSAGGIKVNEATLDARKGVTIGENTLMSSDGIVIVVDENKASLKDIKEIGNKCNNSRTPILGAIFIK